jgi:CheY-like chemotaxis protein
MGFDVDTANNGMQVLLKARRTSPDVMIVDVNMPQLDGLSASFHLLEPGGPPMDVIVVSGYSNDETIAHCEAMGMFYASKQMEFWPSIGRALTEIFPAMALQIGAQIRAAAGGDSLPTHPRVLIVDDDEQVATFLSCRLKKLGIDSLYASNAIRAFRLASGHHPSVVISDFYMPDGDADFLIARLRSNPTTAHIPVFVLSGKPIDEPTLKLLKREVMGNPGASRIFRKSFEVGDLFEAIQQYCAAGPTAAPGL